MEFALLVARAIRKHLFTNVRPTDDDNPFLLTIYHFGWDLWATGLAVAGRSREDDRPGNSDEDLCSRCDSLWE